MTHHASAEILGLTPRDRMQALAEIAGATALGMRCATLTRGLHDITDFLDTLAITGSVVENELGGDLARLVTLFGDRYAAIFAAPQKAQLRADMMGECPAPSAMGAVTRRMTGAFALPGILQEIAATEGLSPRETLEVMAMILVLTALSCSAATLGLDRAELAARIVASRATPRTG